MRQLLLKLIVVYRYVFRPIMPPACRFTPSCSQYASDAITRHGVLLGCWLSLKRVLRCNPWHPGGYDPAP